MREEIYEYLRDYGFSAIEIDKIEKENEGMFYTNLSEVRKNLGFLEDKYLELGDIIDVINENPYMLTEKNNRLEMLDEIYNIKLSIDYDSMKKIIIANPRAYTASPIELEKIISYLEQSNYNKEVIKNLIIKNPKIVSMELEEFIKLMNLVNGEGYGKRII